MDVMEHFAEQNARHLARCSTDAVPSFMVSSSIDQRKLVEYGAGNPFAANAVLMRANNADRELEGLVPTLLLSLGEVVGLSGRELSENLPALENVMMAVGRVQARKATAEKGILADLPSRLWDQLKRSRTDYVRVLVAEAQSRRVLDEMSGRSEALRSLKEQIWRVCFGCNLLETLDLEHVLRRANVLILGESGVGKEDVAAAVQDGTLGAGPPGTKPPKRQYNASAIVETLAGAELFGYVKGAFTGADKERMGLIQSASGGTLFLDEIGDMPLVSQVKLLRVMERDEVSMLGAPGDDPTKVDVRYVAATHKDLDAEVAQGRFRLDLYHRLAGSILRVPSLRERGPDEVQIIAREIVEKYTSPMSGGRGGEMKERVEDFFQRPSTRHYGWPGNVRELRNAVRTLILGEEPILSQSRSSTGPQPSGHGTGGDSSPTIIDKTIDAIAREKWSERELLDHYTKTLARIHGRASAASILGRADSTLRRRTTAMGKK